MDSVETIRVLHVDDEPGLGQLVTDFLEGQIDGFDVATETAPEDGLALLNSAGTPVDCIVSDYDMPGMDGLEFLDVVREQHHDCPFILYTGKGSEDVASEAISRGATDYLQKGGGTEQYELLANRIRNAVEQSRSKQQVANLNRIYTLVANINQALVRANSVDEVEKQVCDLITESEPYVTACIGGVNRETLQIVPRTWAGDPAGYFEELNMAVDEGSTGRHAPVGRAFHEREIAISQNIREDAGYGTWRDAATERGFHSLAVVPMEFEDTLYGLLATFASRPNAFDETEQNLLVELGDDIAHALHAQTLRKKYNQRQQELRRTERQYRALLEDPNILVGVLDTDGTLLKQNQTAIEYIDAEIESVLGEPFWETPWWPTEMRAVVRENVQRAANGEYVDYEANLTRANGDPYTVSGSIRPVTDADGQVVSLVVSARDITEEKQHERELEAVNERSERLAKAAPDGLFLVSTDYSELYYCDPTVSDLYAVDLDEVRRNPSTWIRHVHPDDVDRIQTDMRAQKNGQISGTQQQQFRIQDPDCGTRWIEVDIHPIEADGQVTCLAGVATDVTERKKHTLAPNSMKDSHTNG